MGHTHSMKATFQLFTSFDFSFIWSFCGIWNFGPLLLPLSVSLHNSTEKGTFVLKGQGSGFRSKPLLIKRCACRAILTWTCDRSLSLNCSRTCKAPSSLNSFNASIALSSRSLCATSPGEREQYFKTQSKHLLKCFNQHGVSSGHNIDFMRRFHLLELLLRVILKV